MEVLITNSNQTRLEQHGYPTVSSLEGDLKRMLLNWKETHKKSSQPWKDADDVEMFMTNYFKSRGINPQRDADSRHVAPPTPLPGSNSKDGDDNDESMSAETPTKEEKPRGSRIVLRRTSQKGPVAPSTDEETLENQPVSQKNCPRPFSQTYLHINPSFDSKFDFHLVQTRQQLQ